MRAERKRNNARPEMIRRLRLANLRKLLRDRNGPILPDDDAGREYLFELLLPISIGPHADIKMPNAIEVWAPWMDRNEARAIIDQINLMPMWQRKPPAKVLGQRLKLTNPDRERLKLWTIAPADMGEHGMAWWRKKKKRDRNRRYRRSRGAKPRAEYETTSIRRTKPWLARGISRATWYRVRQVRGELKLSKAEHTLVSQEQAQPPEGGLGEQRGKF
jgi:hypothetical protein